MKRQSDWKAIAELVGIGAIVVSLVFVALQLKQSQDIAIAELRQARQSSIVDLSSLVAEHSDIWMRGNSGEELSAIDQTIYGQLIESQHWAYWTVWNRSNRFDQEVPRRIAVADFAGFLHQNPGARVAWNTYVGNREAVRKRLVSEYDENRFISAVLTDLERLGRTAD